MKQLKYYKFDVENFKGVLYLGSLFITLLICLIFIEHKSYKSSLSYKKDNDINFIDDDIIPITEPIKPTLPPPPPPPPIKEVIEVVENNTDIKKDLEITSEISPNTSINIIELPEDLPDEIEDFIVVEKMPVFGNCNRKKTEEEKKECTQNEIQKYLAKNTRYPINARENGIKGTIIISFVVDKDGKITNIKILRSVHPLLDEEAKRVVSTLPIFEPGEQRGKPVRVMYNMPINFRLE